jgi:serine/threonine protein kinase
MAGTVTLGKVLCGRYRIVKLIGEGGFGAVYKANDERFQATRVVAIKEMNDANLSASEREKALEDFRREANLLVQLNHPNLPLVSDFFEEGTMENRYLLPSILDLSTYILIVNLAHLLHCLITERWQRYRLHIILYLLRILGSRNGARYLWEH